MKNDYDVLIIGGGLAGASLACALANTSLRVAVIEAVPLKASNQPSYDDRTTALAYSSRRIFEGIGVWDNIQKQGACPIKQIHISDRGHFGFTRLHANEAGLEALGYVAINRIIGQSLYAVIEQSDNIEMICPAKVENIHEVEAGMSCGIKQGESSKTVTASLVVMADGGRSGLREAMGIVSHRKDYHQIAIITNVTPFRPHNNVAYERFTETGPLAILPLDNQRCGVVWSTRPENVDEMMGWNDEKFLSELQQRFGNRLGDFERVGKRQAYPLVQTRVDEHIRSRLVLVGNAAHSVHPVAGQGFNLGLRDVATLAQVIVEASQQNQDIGSLSVLRRYEKWRHRDNRVVSRFTDSLVRIFSNRFLPMVVARNIGLIGVDLFPGLKKELTRRTSGLNGRLPRLARGLPLVSDNV